MKDAAYKINCLLLNQTLQKFVIMHNNACLLIEF